MIIYIVLSYIIIGYMIKRSGRIKEMGYFDSLFIFIFSPIMLAFYVVRSVFS